MIRLFSFIIFLTVTFLFIGKESYYALAHSGGLNAQGCHSGSKPYHCHRSASEMVGNRLRCDLGSKSSECRGVPSKPNDKFVDEKNEELASANKIKKISSGPGITVLGINFDLTFKEMRAVLKNRYGCDLDYEGNCYKNGVVVFVKQDKRYRPILIRFDCSAYDGCNLKSTTVFNALMEKFNLTRLKGDYDSIYTLCGKARTGEVVCAATNSIRFYRDSYGLKELSFD